MTIPDETMMQELLKTFHQEAAEHLQTLNQTLLKLERQPASKTRNKLLQEAFRSAHSLKGAARAVSLEQVEAVAHSMEDMLKLARDGRVNLDANSCDILYSMLDAIEAILKNGKPDVDALIRALQAQMQQVAEEETGEEAAPAAEASAEPVENKQGPEPDETLEVPVYEEKSETRFNDNDETIRVAVSKLDALMAEAGELVVTRISAQQRASELQAIRNKVGRFPRLWQDVRTRLDKFDRGREETLNLIESLTEYHAAVQQVLGEVTSVDTMLNRDSLRLGMVAERLQDEMRRVRMVPFYTLDALLQRTVRDVARSENKQAVLLIRGGDVELDKKVLEMLKDPLLHLVRNAVDHGIETPEEREQAGKNSEGSVVIQVTQRGSEAHISISDDGQGFQLEAIRSAVEKVDRGIRSDDALAMAFMPGVSTSHTVTAISGRGVGLDVVRQQVETLQGRISVDNRPGEGASISLMVPVSLAMTRVLLVTAGSMRYALPLAAVEKIIAPERTFSVEGQVMISVDEKPLPLVPLASILSLPITETHEPVVVIMGVAEQRIALMVDDVLTEQELAVKPFSRPLVRVRNLAGAALLGSGEPVVVLNAADIVKTARGVRTASLMPIKSQMGDTLEVEREHILVVDDSITTRTLEKNILQAAGYVVNTATDGLEALNLMRSHEIDLVVADVEMPNLDGISLTRELRESNEFADLPIILVTSLESAEDRERGMIAGANAYIVKRGFNQAELLATIRQFL